VRLRTPSREAGAIPERRDKCTVVERFPWPLAKLEGSKCWGGSNMVHIEKEILKSPN
jgi:hypothetical protein